MHGMMHRQSSENHGFQMISLINFDFVLFSFPVMVHSKRRESRRVRSAGKKETRAAVAAAVAAVAAAALAERLVSYT